MPVFVNGEVGWFDAKAALTAQIWFDTVQSAPFPQPRRLYASARFPILSHRMGFQSIIARFRIIHHIFVFYRLWWHIANTC